MHVERVRDRWSKRAANWFGQIFNVKRPDYADKDTVESLVGVDKKFRTDPGGDRWIYIPVPGVRYIEIQGDRSLLKTGDLLVLATDDNMTPVMTILQFAETQPLIAVRTNKIASITDGLVADGKVYTNIRFDFVSIPNVGEGMNDKVIGVLGYAAKKVIIYTRKGVHPGQYFRFNELRKDGTNIERRYRIDGVEDREPLLLLSISEETA